MKNSLYSLNLAQDNILVWATNKSPCSNQGYLHQSNHHQGYLDQSRYFYKKYLGGSSLATDMQSGHFEMKV